jgi:hypothetical protein
MIKVSAYAVILIVILTGTLPGAASADERGTVMVEEIRTTPEGAILTFDANGVKTGKLTKADLPNPPFPALDYNDDTKFVKVASPAGEVWLRGSQAKVSVKAGVLTTCEVMARFDPAGRVPPGKQRADAGQSQAGRSGDEICPK